MSKLKKVRNIFISSLLSIVLVGSVALLPYYQVKAEAITGVIGVASSGVALLSLLALSGVGMELENQQKFQELSDDEKLRIENGLAKDFNDVALQRGMALDKVSNWLNDVKNGVVDKSSEVYSMFKDWAKNIDLKKSSANNPADNYPVGAIPPTVSFPISVTSKGGNTTVLNYDSITKQYFDGITASFSLVYVTFRPDGLYNGYLQVIGVNRNGNLYNIVSYQTYYYGGGTVGTVGGWRANGTSGVSDIVVNSPNQLIKSYGNDNIIINIDGVPQSGNFIDSNADVISYFKTNTDYLERLKGQDTDTVEVIDVTDIKHPIIESVPNTKAELSYNKGFKRPTPDDNDDDVVVGGLVPTNVYYEALDDYNEGLRNEVVEYDQNIQQHPENQDKIFVSPTPIINVHNIYNTLPVVNIPVSNTVVNNNYTYNNTYNKNVTINELPYNAELIPYLPTMLFENKFPFCIPFDIYTLFSVFYVEREAPVFTFDVPFPSENGLEVQQITLGLQDFEYCALVLRIMWYFLFLLGLMLISRKLIKG